MRTEACEDEVIVSTRRDVPVLLGKCHARSIFHLERNRNYHETFRMRSHENDDAPRACSQGQPGASNCTYCTARPLGNFPIPHTWTPHPPATAAAALLCMLPWAALLGSKQYLVCSLDDCTPTTARLLAYKRHCLFCQLGLFLAKSLY